MRRLLLLLCTVCACPGIAAAADDMRDAADTAEVYVYGKDAKDEALLQHLTDPDAYDAMAKSRSEDKSRPRENVRVKDVDVTPIDDTHAVARTTVTEKHRGGTRVEEVPLVKKDGKWQVTNPPPLEPAK